MEAAGTGGKRLFFVGLAVSCARLMIVGNVHTVADSIRTFTQQLLHEVYNH